MLWCVRLLHARLEVPPQAGYAASVPSSQSGAAFVSSVLPSLHQHLSLFFIQVRLIFIFTLSILELKFSVSITARCSWGMFSASADSPAGLLPAYPALQCLPASHAPLEALVSRLPALLRGSDAAALAAAVSALPLLPLPADDTDSVLLHALHRDYAFVASAFVLEPRHRRLGAPRASLPAQLAVPLWGVAHRLGLPPLLEYTAYGAQGW